MGDAGHTRRDVRLIVGAVGLSSLGDFLLWIPLTLHLREMTDSGFAVAALMICLWAPIVILAPISGWIVDRFETRRVLIIVSLAQATVAGSLALALDSTAVILVLAAALGAGFSVAQPAEFALVPVIARGRELTAVNGYIETARYAGITAGPVLGGVLSGAGGTEIALAVNGASFIVVRWRPPRCRLAGGPRPATRPRRGSMLSSAPPSCSPIGSWPSCSASSSPRCSS
jgi:MFS family permease